MSLVPHSEVLEIPTQSVYVRLCEVWSPIDDIDHLEQMVNPVSSCVRAMASPKEIINQKRHFLCSLEDGETLYATATTWLVAVKNEKLLHWENNTDGEHNHELEYTIGCKSHTFTKLSERIALHDTLKNAEITDLEIYKKFLPEEVSPERRLKTRVSVPGRSNLDFYQRKYVLETGVYFTYSGWDQLCIVVDHNDNPQKLKILTTIHSAEFITTDQELREMAEMKITGQTKWPDIKDCHPHRFGHLTERAKTVLRGLGVAG